METAPTETLMDEQAYLPPENVTDLPLAAKQTEVIKGGPSCQHNLKQIGIALHSYN